MDSNKKKEELLQAAEESIDHLISVLKEKIITGEKGEDLSADKLKNAAAAKKQSFMDALEILKKIEEERNIMNGKPKEDKVEKKPRLGFAERIAGGK